MLPIVPIVMALFVLTANAQIDPCYCIQRIGWNQVTNRWETEACGGNCFALEGACGDKQETVGDTLFVWCACANVAYPSCNCFGKARNPNYDPTMQEPGIDCATLSPCHQPATCNWSHIVQTWGWGNGIPICQCNDS